MHGGQSGICKFLKGAGTKSHLFIRCVSGFSRGALEGAGAGKCTPYHPLYETLITEAKFTNSLKNGSELLIFFIYTLT